MGDNLFVMSDLQMSEKGCKNKPGKHLVQYPALETQKIFTYSRNDIHLSVFILLVVDSTFMSLFSFLWRWI